MNVDHCVTGCSILTLAEVDKQDISLLSWIFDSILLIDYFEQFLFFHYF